MNPKLKAIAEHAASDLVELVRDKESEILEAWNAAEEEAQLQETKPKFRLSLAITLDIDSNSMETALTFAIRRKLTVNREIPDMDQGRLALDDTTVTLSTAGTQPVTMSGKAFSKACKEISKKSKAA